MAKIWRDGRLFLWVVTLLLGPGCASLPEREAQVSWITKEELKSSLGSPGLTILDVRKKPDWEMSSQKIQKAVHEDYERVKEWAEKYSRDRTFVLYCA